MYPPREFAGDAEEEEIEGIWGYLYPMDTRFGDRLVLKKRTVCPAPTAPLEISKKAIKTKKGRGRASLAKEEEDYEKTKVEKGFPAGGYLLGRHVECGKRP